MAYVQKRKTTGGTQWIARWDAYVDGERKERSRKFDKEKEAKEFLSKLGIRKPSSSEPLKALTDSYLADFESAVKAKQREESTLRQLRQHVDLHILSDCQFAALKCGDIGTPEVQAFLNRLYGRVSPALTGKVRTTLSQVFKFGSRTGYISVNPVRDTEVKLTDRAEAGEAGEQFILPPQEDLRQLLSASRTFDNTGRAEAVVRTFMFAGLRASELRGLPIRTLSLDAQQPKLRVDQRADRFDKIGRVKSKMARRDIVLGPETVKAIQQWLHTAPKSQFVFPNYAGNVWSYPNLWHRFWVPLMNHAGLVTDEPASETVRGGSKEQEQFKQPRFGLHMLRHVYASLQIARGVTPKRLQALMGHSTLKLTMDTYSHLWPNDEEDKLAAAVESALG